MRTEYDEREDLDFWWDEVREATHELYGALQSIAGGLHGIESLSPDYQPKRAGWAEREARRAIERYRPLIEKLYDMAYAPAVSASADLDAGLPTVADVVGSDPDFTGGLTTQEYLDRIRSEGVSTEPTDIRNEDGLQVVKCDHRGSPHMPHEWEGPTDRDPAPLYACPGWSGPAAVQDDDYAAEGQSADTWLCDDCGRQVSGVYAWCDVCSPDRKQEQRCPVCNGDGSGPFGADSCGRCAGEGFVDTSVHGPTAAAQSEFVEEVRDLLAMME